MVNVEHTGPGTGQVQSANADIRPISMPFECVSDADHCAIVFAENFSQAVKKFRNQYDLDEDEVASIRLLDADAVS